MVASISPLFTKLPAFTNPMNIPENVALIQVDFSMNNQGKGKIVIPFNSPADLERIVKIIENQK